jgi:hypothetical protein
MSVPGPIQRYHFEPILNWWHSPFKHQDQQSFQLTELIRCLPIKEMIREGHRGLKLPRNVDWRWVKESCSFWFLCLTAPEENTDRQKQREALTSRPEAQDSAGVRTEVGTKHEAAD